MRKLLMIMLLFGIGQAWGQNKYQPYYKPGGYPKPIPKDEDKTNYRDLGGILPDFRIVTLPERNVDDSSKPDIPARSITKDDVKSDANLFLFLFNPTCEHCENMTELLEKNISLFQRSKILMVAAQHMGPYLELFEKGLKTNEYARVITVGIDSSHLVDRTFMYMSLPQINIYNKERVLIRRFSGEVSIDSLRKYIQ